MTDATVPEARSDATLRKFALRRLRLPVGAGVLSLVVPDAGDWIRRGTWTAGRLRGGEPPYWVQIWPASLRLAQLVARRRGLGGVSVLDLGCGLGLPGIASARCGASVTFVDREADALAFAVWNALLVLPVVPP